MGRSHSHMELHNPNECYMLHIMNNIGKKMLLCNVNYAWEIFELSSIVNLPWYQLPYWASGGAYGFMRVKGSPTPAGAFPTFIYSQPDL